MNLTDAEILELNDLCNAVVEGKITGAQMSRLSRWLADSAEARQFYVRALGLSASLFSYAGEMQLEAPDELVRHGKILRPRFLWGLGSLAAAAAIILALFVMKEAHSPERAAQVAFAESIAQLTALKECQWAESDLAPRPGDQLRKGQRLELAKGLAEITFDSGAQVVLQGPASLELNSAWDTTLLRGALKASVPPEAIGFRVRNHAVEVRDLGTAFTMIADASGATDVLVLKGAVEAEPQESDDRKVVLLREKESRRFARTGVSSISDSEEKFARFTRVLPLDHFAPTAGYVHWSFDELDGRTVKADVDGQPKQGFDVQLASISKASLTYAQSGGVRGKALKFDGHFYAKAAFPGMSGNDARTVAFWVRVPEDAMLSDAYALVAWRAASDKLGSRPVHISWNRNPAEGAVGVLRTDYGRGYALGATSLRDGRWHHVAVVFVPGDDRNTPVEVKQYVDGKLEGEGAPSPSGSLNRVPEPGVAEAAAINNVVWLGCRLGNSGPRKERFRGELDELFIADRAISAMEIVTLMKENQPRPREVAVVK